MTKLYSLIQVEKETGKRAVVYGHATENVIQEFLTAYINTSHYVIVQEYDPATESVSEPR